MIVLPHDCLTNRGIKFHVGAEVGVALLHSERKRRFQANSGTLSSHVHCRVHFRTKECPPISYKKTITMGSCVCFLAGRTKLEILAYL